MALQPTTKTAMCVPNDLFLKHSLSKLLLIVLTLLIKRAVELYLLCTCSGWPLLFLLQAELLEIEEDSNFHEAQAKWALGTMPRRNRRLIELTHSAGHDISCPQRPEVGAFIEYSLHSYFWHALPT
jgi:hypothetical protein